MKTETQATGSRFEFLKALPWYFIPHHAVSQLLFRLTRVRAPWFKNRFIDIFARHYGIDWREARKQRSADFAHFNAFFTRALQPDARPLEGDDDTVISPADGRISQIGDIHNESILQAKGRTFTVAELLGDDADSAAALTDGRFATIYLSPRDYHRVHMPLGGRLRKTIYIPGRLFSVAPYTTRTIPRLFARNERLVCLFDSDTGPFAVIMVGALNVAAIETVWAGLVTRPRPGKRVVEDFRERDVVLSRGAEMGRFNMGSTVILLMHKRQVAWSSDLAPGTRVKMGRRIGSRPLDP